MTKTYEKETVIIKIIGNLLCPEEPLKVFLVACINRTACTYLRSGWDGDRHATDKLNGRCQLTKSNKFTLLWFTVAKIAKIYLVKHPKVSVDMCLGT